MSTQKLEKKGEIEKRGMNKNNGIEAKKKEI